MKRRARFISAGLLIGVLVMSPLAANAEGDEKAPSAPETFQITLPMNVGGYDATVAEANGFKIVTHEDGSQESVPVTEQAKASVAAAERAKSAASASKTKETGNCGWSLLEGRKGRDSWIDFRTAYSVYLPVTHRNWTVTAQGFLTGFTQTWPSASTGTYWESQSAGQAVGPGQIYVTAGSNVVLTNGSVCFSLSPGFSFS